MLLEKTGTPCKCMHTCACTLDNIGLVTFWFLREHTIEDLGNLIFCDASREKPVQNNGGWRAQSIACLHLALVLRLAGSVAKTHRMPKFAGHVSPKGPFGAKEPLIIGLFCGRTLTALSSKTKT